MVWDRACCGLGTLEGLHGGSRSPSPPSTPVCPASTTPATTRLTGHLDSPPQRKRLSRVRPDMGRRGCCGDSGGVVGGLGVGQVSDTLRTGSPSLGCPGAGSQARLRGPWSGRLATQQVSEKQPHPGVRPQPTCSSLGSLKAGSLATTSQVRLRSQGKHPPGPWGYGSGFPG